MKLLFRLFIAISSSIVFSQNDTNVLNIKNSNGITHKTILIGPQKEILDELKTSKYNDFKIITNFTDKCILKSNSRDSWTYSNNLLFINQKTNKLNNLNSVNLNTGTSNKFLFNGLTDVYHYSDGNYDINGEYGRWWGSTEFNTSNIWSRYLDYNNGTGRYNYNK